MDNGTKTTAQKRLPVPTSRKVFTSRGSTYEILRFPEGLNLKQTIDATEGMKAKGLDMLTRQEAMEIRDNPEPSAVFKERLKLGEWTYVRDKGVESKSQAAFLGHGWVSLELIVYDCCRPDLVSRVVILKKIGSEATAAQDKPEKPDELLRKAGGALSRLSGKAEDIETVREFIRVKWLERR